MSDKIVIVESEWGVFQPYIHAKINGEEIQALYIDKSILDFKIGFKGIHFKIRVLDSTQKRLSSHLKAPLINNVHDFVASPMPGMVMNIAGEFLVMQLLKIRL
jgi:hypothetical protein